MKKSHIKGPRFKDTPADCFWIESVGGGRVERFLIYSPQIWGVWTHFSNEHKLTTPCYKNHKFCFGGHDPRSLRWKGYLFCHSEARKRNEFLQLTEGGAKHLLSQLGPEVALRGLCLDVRRTASKQGRQYVSIADYIIRDPRSFPVDVSPRVTLYNTWKIPDPGHEFATDPEFGSVVLAALG